MAYNQQLHAELLELGKKLETHITHTLEKPFCETIVATLEFFGASEIQKRQAVVDLFQAKFKIWDLLGIWYTGGLHAEGELFDCVENLVKLYILQKHVGGFAWWLRGHDLEIEKPSHCEDCIESYDTWKKEENTL